MTVSGKDTFSIFSNLIYLILFELEALQGNTQSRHVKPCLTHIIPSPYNSLGNNCFHFFQQHGLESLALSFKLKSAGT